MSSKPTSSTHSSWRSFPVICHTATRISCLTLTSSLNFLTSCSCGNTRAFLLDHLFCLPISA